MYYRYDAYCQIYRRTWKDSYGAQC